MLNLKTLSVIIIIVILCVASIGFIYVSGDSWWTKPTGFGMLAVNVKINYADGSVKDLKLMSENSIYRFFNTLSLTPTRGGNTITSITYTLSAKAQGEGYDSVTLDLSDLVFTAEVSNHQTYTYSSTTTTYNIPIDNSLHQLFTLNLRSSDNVFGQNILDPGDYTLYLKLSGSVRYKGNPDGEWQTVTSLPNDVVITYTLEDNSWVEIDFATSTQLNYS